MSNVEVASIVDEVVRRCVKLPADQRLSYIVNYSRKLLLDGLAQETILEIERMARQRLGIQGSQGQ